MRWVLLVLLSSPAWAGDIPPGRLLSGFDQMQDTTQAMQRDDTANPGMLSVRMGETLWHQKSGGASKSCNECHTVEAMRGVATRYPVFDTKTGRPIDLAGKINQCRSDRQEAPALSSEAQEALALAAFVGFQSRGMPLSPPQDVRLEPFRAEGEKLFSTRMGQLNLSCAQCHTDNWGQKLGSSIIPQGHANGYPLYRLEWQGMGSFARRLRNCMIGVRAEPFAAGSQEAVNLELYLATRAGRLTVEIPAVRP